MTFNRDKKNIISYWWWTIDKWSLLAVIAIISIGVMLVATGSPAVAERIDANGTFFIKRHLVFVCISLSVILITSLMNPNLIKLLSIIGIIICLIMMILVLALGEEVKGARRWISLMGISLQPSEFMKPLFIIITAIILSKSSLIKNYNNFKISALIYIIIAALLIKQPDFGMTIVVTAVWAGQLVVAGMSWSLVAIIGALTIVGAIFAYTFLPHVTKRINGFLDMSDANNYQVQKSLEAFNNGGLFGTGPGEGVVKLNLPDSHTDFIFAVAGEELGAIAILLIIGLYAFIVIRGFIRMQQEHNLFTIYAVSGLLILFGLQAMVNMGVSLRLLPTKGMTLPFISYGGSSMLAMSAAIGIMLSLTRKRYGQILSRNINLGYKRR